MFLSLFWVHKYQYLKLTLFLDHADLQGRPKGVTPKFSLAPLVPRLNELLGIQVVYLFIYFVNYLILLFVDEI